MSESNSIGRTLSAMFLVAGTCIGGGMLGLPVATALLGFGPATLVMTLCCLMMTATALLYLEVCLEMEDGVHVMTMASRLLGPWAKILSLVLFVFVTYASIGAYTAAGGEQLASALTHWAGFSAGAQEGNLLFLLLLGLVIFIQEDFVERVNNLLFIGMLAAYLGLLGIGWDDVSMENLSRSSWPCCFAAVPVLLTAFSFQSFLVPTVVHYLHRDLRSLRWAFIGGGLVTLLFYLVWQWLVLGTVPYEGANGLEVAFAKGEPATFYFSRAVSSPVVAKIAEFFAFFAVATSFLGMTVGLVDFLSDSFHIKRKGWGTAAIAALALVPTFVIGTYLERIFTNALDLTGGIGDTMINGMIPVMLVWVLRYKQKRSSAFRLKGGKLALALIFAFFAVIFGYEVWTWTLAGLG